MRAKNVPTPTTFVWFVWFVDESLVRHYSSSLRASSGSMIGTPSRIG
jgi:hypothetical protein